MKQTIGYVNFKLEEMALSSKRKSRWRYRFWQRVFQILIGVPLLIAVVLSLVSVFRAIFIADDGRLVLHIINEQETIEMVDEAQILKRAERLAGALKIATISYDIDKQEKEKLLEYGQYLKKSFPFIHNCTFITREVINTYSLLYTVQGTTRGKLPYLLASHLDVVPVDERAWDVPPFSGKIVNQTYVYGRGAIDDKAGVMGIMEAVEYMLQKGQRPRRTFYLAFGHDEEVSGKRGAQELAKALIARGVNRLDFVVDEGFPLSKEIILGTDRHVAMVGVSEKGMATLELSVAGTPGHSSFPPSESAIGILAAAVAKLEQNQQPSLLGQGPESAMFKYLAPHETEIRMARQEFKLRSFRKGSPVSSTAPYLAPYCTISGAVMGLKGFAGVGDLCAAKPGTDRQQRSLKPGLIVTQSGRKIATEWTEVLKKLIMVSFGYRVLYSNLWLFSGLMAREMEHRPITNAIIRTTTAITMFNAGIKSNVVPPSAKAIINHRIHPSQKVDDVMAYDRKVIDDARIKIRLKISREAHPISPFGPDSVPYQVVAASIRHVYPDAIVVPAVFIANTDTRWYLSFTSYLYRFLPTVVLPDDITRYHGNNERISIQHFHKAVNFYYRLIRNADILIDQVPASTVKNKEEEL